MKNLIIFMYSLLTLIACGTKYETGKTKFRLFSGSVTTGTAQFTGGILIFGRSADGTQGFIVPYSDNLELNLKKGSWEVGTIGWMGTAPIEGTQQCDMQLVELSNDTFTINFNMNFSKCLTGTTSDGKYFTDPLYYHTPISGFGTQGFKKLQVRTCADFTSTNCGGSMQIGAHAGSPSSYKVSIPPMLSGGVTLSTGSVAPLESNCVTSLPGGNITPPMGGATGFLATQITTFVATAAKFAAPAGLVFDQAGNLLVLETSSSFSDIRLIDTNNFTHSLTGKFGITLFDGISSVATFYNPEGIVMNNTTHDIFVTDSNSHTIRKINPANGDVSTFAGIAGTFGNVNATGTSASFKTPKGITIDQATGDLYVADTGNNQIRKITSAGVVTLVTGLPAGGAGNLDSTLSASSLTAPTGIVFYNNFIFVTNPTTNRIRKIDLVGNTVTTLAGSGVLGSADGTGAGATFNYPLGITVNPANGDLYVSESGGELIRKITQAGVVTTIAGTTQSAGLVDGVGNAAKFNYPYGLAFIPSGPSGTLFVADENNQVIRKIDLSNNNVATLTGQSNQSGHVDGPPSISPCSGMSRHYYFQHGFGEGLNASYMDNGMMSLRRGQILPDIGTGGGQPLTGSSGSTLPVVNFKGTFSTASVFPSLPTMGDLYIYKGGANMTIAPYVVVDHYAYYNGASWSDVPQSDAVKLILMDVN